MAGREGLVDTAVKTAETGYMQRRLVKVEINSIKHENYIVYKVLFFECFKPWHFYTSFTLIEPPSVFLGC